MKTVAIIQSSYIPWRGYFDIIRRVDDFILLDSVQYTRRDWRNRNRIKTPDGSAWLSIPIRAMPLGQPVAAAITSNHSWAEKHWRSMQHNYTHAPFFGEFAGELQRLYETAAKMERLSDINEMFIRAIANWLKIDTTIHRDTGFTLQPGPNERLISLCGQVGADTYLSGPAARSYLDETAFAEAGIAVEWMTYDYAPYPQRFPPFIDRLSIVDLLFNAGAAAFEGNQGREE